MVSSLLISLLIIISVAALAVYFLYYKEKKVGNVFLYEKVGRYEKFDNIYPLYLIRANSVDVYKIGGIINKIIDKPAPEDFFLSTKGTKILHCTKFSEDDYRIKKRFDETWYREEQIPVFKEEERINQNTGELEIVQVPTKEFQLVKEYYKEPLGISQEGRDAIRSGLENERMLKEELKDNTWWDKWGSPIMIVAVVLLCSMTIMSVSKDNRAAIEATAKVCNENYDVIREEINKPSYVEGIYNKLREQEAIANTPAS